MKDLVIAGAGGFGRELYQWIKDGNKRKSEDEKWRVRGFIDDNLHALDNIECDLEVVDSIGGYRPREQEWVAMAIAKPAIKERIVGELKKRGCRFASIIHHTAIIGDFTSVGEGVVMYPDAAVSVNSRIGNFVTLLSSGLGHDVEIEDYVTISSMCDICGGVRIGKRVFLGSHVTIVPGRRIGDDAYIAAGSTVMTNIKPGYRVMGNPAKKMDL